MEYEKYSSKDFAADENFVKWVKYPDTESELFWNQWLRDNPSKETIIAEARLFIQLINFHQHPETPQRIERVWQRISQSTRPSQTSTISEVHQLRPIATLWQKWHTVAAVFIGTLLINTLLFISTINQNQTTEYQTAFGETKTIKLPDGSEVILNANSTVSFNKKWKIDRDILLKGEAFFMVQEKQIIHPESGKVMAKFTVHTGNATVQVLGTQFNVSDRNENTSIVLRTGKIKLKLKNQKDTILMKPGELVTYNGPKKKITRKVVNPIVYTSWKDKEWVLENQSLEEVCAKIEDTYGVDVVIADPRIANETVSGVVPTANLTDLLKALSASLDIKITQNQKQIIMRD